MKKYILTSVLLLILCAASAQTALKKGTPVYVELTTEANSNNKREVKAIIAMDINDPASGETLVTKGTPLTLHVERRRSRGLGKAGWLQIKTISTQAVDGRTIRLDGLYDKEGEKRKGAALGLGIGLGLTYLPGFGFFFLMLKGEKVILPAGTMLYDIYIAENYTIDIR